MKNKINQVRNLQTELKKVNEKDKIKDEKNYEIY